ncbi:hypothetical protein B0H15DRAFT_853101 [Mycena belliarum]|uniref:Extracellular membrane protein CFEM domain-containing protein n=1 Tax=Mycena belliarum TaxID=1033014 RepID=A0AAD6XMQ8_9AGAR|nr:hypothetical protein B0H15DRAFT_853101 [Mycena belliae]
MMYHLLPLLLLLAFALGGHAQSSSSASRSASSSPSSKAIGTPTNSANLPSLSGVSSCVTNCLAVAAGAAGCGSQVAVDCFCHGTAVSSYIRAFQGCLQTCPTEVASAQALVEQFCAASSPSTSLSFPSFTASASSSASRSSGSSLSPSGSGSASVTAPASSSAASSTTSSNSAVVAHPLGLPLRSAALGLAGALIGVLLVR